MEKINIIQHLKEHLIKLFGDDIDEVVLFGSRVSGKAGDFSDYDVLVILSCNYDWRYKNKIFDAVADIELEHEIIIDFHLISAEELKNSIRGKLPLFQQAIKNGTKV
ncbi:MAG: nucleotidyltransferase domain-containing protein [Candidatus Helarchaeota archaeon]